ncbi:four helix bundle protein [Mucilaginibacter sp. KACC 22063]|uniref:four helix bundle protein n=1 Tax=Mucilaginibacter sp. KACC 22063 TaxID=3025666 RepID=UPI002366D91B|nr:four helix bundle protein [Mucilaginibacter sp. KACC 22063]WDF55946.1 four helix bundle protein [Mucilaginibacter sp. KACC 22063]
MKVWQKAMYLTDLTYSYCKDLPADERFNLIDQINRCSVSIASNIAEGSGKRTNTHNAEFLSTSLSSSYELETQLLICRRRGYGHSDKLDNCLQLFDEVQKMIFAFREHVINKAVIS